MKVRFSGQFQKVFRIKKSSKKEVQSKWAGRAVLDEPWYAYNANYGTDEEKKFVELFARRFEGLNKISEHSPDS
jgi:type III restriction enzyme